MRFKASLILIAMLAWLLAGCTTLPSPQERSFSASQYATAAGWQASDLDGGTFLLRAYLPKLLEKAPVLTIYIEGDGLAWASRSQPSSNPTPANPLALKLALRDDQPAVYLGRPCQYVDPGLQPTCTQKYWTSHRFAPEVINATQSAIDQLKARFHSSRLVLVGYSGGGAVAALAAAGRNDVMQLMTIAGNLDHVAWSQRHHLTPLSGSLNPADALHQLKDIPQTHFVGLRDTNVSVEDLEAYARRFPDNADITIVRVPDFDHSCCWERAWPGIKPKVR